MSRGFELVKWEFRNFVCWPIAEPALERIHAKHVCSCPSHSSDLGSQAYVYTSALEGVRKRAKTWVVGTLLPSGHCEPLSMFLENSSLRFYEESLVWDPSRFH